MMNRLAYCNLHGRNAQALTRPLLVFLLVLSLSACESLDLPGLTRTADSPAGAMRQADRGQHAAAARSYESLAEGAQEITRQRYRLLAAQQWLRAERALEAQRILESLPVPTRDDPLQALWSVVSAHYELQREQPEIALEILDNMVPVTMGQSMRLDAEALRSVALFRTGQTLIAVEGLIRRELWLDTVEKVTENHQMIWDGIKLSEPENVQSALSESTDPVASCWLRLVQVAQAGQSNAFVMQRGLSQWQTECENHPALADFYPALLNQETELGDYPRQVALILPLSGRNAGAGIAIRDGFVAAFLTDQTAPQKPLIKVYDSNSENSTVSYEQALADGAEIIVGPLTKTEIAELVNTGGVRIPTLALNNLGDEISAPAGLYQFALAPEDEAAEAARRAIADGLTRALVLVPESNWGTRISNEFKLALEAYGGNVLDIQVYDPREKDFAAPIQSLTQVSSSVARYRSVRRLLGEPLQFEPRRRQDVDFILLGANTAQGRLINPQLKFHYAGDLPVYATSAIFSADGRSNKDLNGIGFPEIPFVANKSGQQTALRNDFARYFKNADRSARLHAMGVDAYQLMLAIFTGNAPNIEAPILGLTGDLSIDYAGRVHRRLPWVVFEDGAPVRQADISRSFAPPPTVVPESIEWPEAGSSN